MLRRVTAFIKEYGMLETGSCVVAAVSGGADSVCLFHLLSRLRREFQLELVAVHVHHGLRGAEADRDAEFVKRMAAGLEVPCVVVYENVAVFAAEQGLSVEEAGRILRYRALRNQAELLGGGSRNVRIAVAHQKEDQAETILHNLFRGSSLKGLSGMSPVSGDIIRPLLCVSRQEILEYLEKNGLEFCADSTNDSGQYTRNRIRRMLPQICRDINEGALEHILEAGEKMAQADAFFERQAAEIWERQGRQEEGRCGVPVSVLSGQPGILSGYLIMKMIKYLSGSVKDIASVHVEQVLSLAEKPTGRQIDLPYGLRALREYQMLWIEKEAGSAPAIEAGDFEFSRFPWKKNQEIPQNRYTKWFDYDKIKGTLSVRTRQTGDYITLKGGGRKTVKAFMIDEKIPRRERDRILLLAEENHVLWIVGYRISEYYKVTAHTKEILQVQVDGGEEHVREHSGTSAGRESE